MDVLRKAHHDLNAYQFKLRLGDIRIRQMSRRYRDLVTAGDKAAAIEQARAQLDFELEEYKERCHNYPTDLALKFELGKRLFLATKYDEAIASLQQAQRDPLEEHVESLATESTEALLASLQHSVDQLQGQMARQRDSLAGLLSDQRAAMTFVTAAPSPRADDRPMAAGEHVSAAAPTTSDLRSRVLALTEDGLSDRAIARELNVGLEEVRIARLRGGRT
jgi:tetratricopeptide (TPR) repeat protein